MARKKASRPGNNNDYDDIANAKKRKKSKPSVDALSMKLETNTSALLQQNRCCDGARATEKKKMLFQHSDSNGKSCVEGVRTRGQIKHFGELNKDILMPQCKQQIGGLYTSRRRMEIATTNKKSSISFLPKEIIFNILLCLPADIIHDVMQYVCWEWYNIIHDPNFINEHLLRSTTNIFTQSPNVPNETYFVEMGECDVKVTKMGFGFPGLVLATCNGLVLYKEPYCFASYKLRGCRFILHVANPVTKQRVTLPPCVSSYFLYTSCSGLAYAASTREYKVVHALKDRSLGFRCFIFTIGVDFEWRPVDTRCCVFDCNPICTGGFIYWPRCGKRCFVGLDVETERIHEFTVPEGYAERIREFSPMGSFLSYATGRNVFSWELWVLAKPKTGEWTRMPNIDIQVQRNIYEGTLFSNAVNFHPDDWWNNSKYFMCPVWWLKDGEMVVFSIRCASKTYIAHNIKTGVAYSFTLDGYKWSVDRPHVPSLVSWKL